MAITERLKLILDGDAPGGPLGPLARELALGTLLDSMETRLDAVEAEVGTGGTLTMDVISEATSGAGITIDGLLVKDERIQPTGSTIATGDAGVTLKDNLASAWDYKQSSNVYLAFRTTDSDEAIVIGKIFDASSMLTGVGGVSLADNLAAAWTVKQSSASYLTFVTTDAAESVAAGKRLTTTDGVASGTARIVGGVAFVDPSASTAVTGATETITNFDNTYTLPAASLKVGTVVRIKARGHHTATTGSETLILTVRAGSTALAVTGNIDPAANDMWEIDFEFEVRAVGASGELVGTGVCRSGTRGGTTFVQHFLGTGATTASHVVVDTTASQVLAIAITHQGSATDSNSSRMDSMTVKVTG